MKQGVDIQALAKQIAENQEIKKDFIADTRDLALTSDAQALEVKERVGLTTEVGEIAHRQIGDRIGIPARYYERCRKEAPALLAENVNHWFQNKPEQRMVRCLGNEARAFLSKKFARHYENEDILGAVLPIFAEHSGLEIVSCQVTEKFMYLKAVSARVIGEVAKGDPVRAGICISNSEVGLGSWNMKRFVDRLICTNGMVISETDKQFNFMVRHLGSAYATEGVTELLSDEAVKADGQAMMLKARDITAAALSQEALDRTIERFRDAAQQKIEGSPVKAVEVLTKRTSLGDWEKDSVLQHFCAGGDLSKWGLANAVTRTAEDCKSYDRATELETLGGKIIELPRKEWELIAQAA